VGVRLRVAVLDALGLESGLDVGLEVHRDHLLSVLLVFVARPAPPMMTRDLARSGVMAPGIYIILMYRHVHI
jgi:hypothetical protein